MFRQRIFSLLFVLLLLSGLLFRIEPARGNGRPTALPGDASTGMSGEPPINLASTIHGFQVGFAREYGKTTIWLRICADAPSFQLRSEYVGVWQTEIFHRTDAAGGCSPSPTSWWRMIYNADPNPDAVFRIYGTANDAVLSEAAFMQRAARIDCRVTGYGTGSCAPADPRVSALTGALDEPAPGAQLSGTAQIRGWVTDGGSWNGPGIGEVRIQVNGADIGAATYGAARGDVAGFMGDARFTNSQFQFALDTTRLPNGPATIRVSYRSNLPGQPLAALERQVTINNATPNQAPNPPHLVGPAEGAALNDSRVTLQAQDAGDPDNGPRGYRDFFFRIEKSDGSWSAESGWTTGTAWTLTLPGAGAYLWRVMAGDGQAASPWAGPRSLTYSPPAPPDTILNVRYVDQVFAQRTLISNMWFYCGPSTLAMMLHYYGKEGRDVFNDRGPTVELAREMGVNPSVGTPGGGIQGALRRRGLSFAEGVMPAAELRAVIAGGRPVMISTRNPNHIFLIVGARANGNFVVHDPMGGRFWGDWSPTANRNDVPWTPPFDSPRTKGATLPGQGQYVEYSYADLATLGIKWMLRITGDAPPIRTTNAHVNAAGGLFTGEQLRIRFGVVGATSLTADTMISLTHTPQWAPEQPYEGYTNPLAAFRLSALDAEQQPLAEIDQPFSLQVAIDPLYFTTWNDSAGTTTGEQGQAAPATARRPITEALVLAIWDATAETWRELPTSVDAENHQVIAQSRQFGEFAVFVRPERYTSFLPIVVQ